MAWLHHERDIHITDRPYLYSLSRFHAGGKTALTVACFYILVVSGAGIATPTLVSSSGCRYLEVSTGWAELYGSPVGGVLTRCMHLVGGPTNLCHGHCWL